MPISGLLNDCFRYVMAGMLNQNPAGPRSTLSVFVAFQAKGRHWRLSLRPGPGIDRCWRNPVSSWMYSGICLGQR